MSVMKNPVFRSHIINASVTYGDKKPITKRIGEKVANVPTLIGIVFLFFTVKVAAEQLAMIVLRN